MCISISPNDWQMIIIIKVYQVKLVPTVNIALTHNNSDRHTHVVSESFISI